MGKRGISKFIPPVPQTKKKRKIFNLLQGALKTCSTRMPEARQNLDS
jgi:hypothetical protein